MFHLRRKHVTLAAPPAAQKYRAAADDVAALRILGLPLKRTHVAPISHGTWLAALVGGHSAINCGNVVDGDTPSGQEPKRVRLGRSAVIGKLAEVQLLGSDAELVTLRLIEAAGVAGAFYVIAARGRVVAFALAIYQGVHQRR